MKCDQKPYRSAMKRNDVFCIKDCDKILLFSYNFGRKSLKVQKELLRRKSEAKKVETVIFVSAYKYRLQKNIMESR